MGDVRWGTHDEFTDLYEVFLKRAYSAVSGAQAVHHTQCRLVRSIRDAIGNRDSTRVLDCAAGTGFPGLALAAKAGAGVSIHCSDGDPAMVAILEKRAGDFGVNPADLAPPRWLGQSVPDGISPMILDWSHLGNLEGRYDYVLCRGNSLAYADTWTGGQRVASDLALQGYLEKMADKVRPGGFLHVDAPWELGLTATTYRDHESEDGSTWEQVTVERDRREWWLSFKPAGGGPRIQFKRYSSLLTIHRVADILDRLGFGHTRPFQMEGERSVFGTIIARRPPNRDYA